MSGRLMTYKQIVDEFGASIWFWRTKKWQGKLKNCGFGNKHMFDRQDIEKLIQEMKQQG
ncbi:DNA-binding protein [Desulfoluna butyratoxydans]|uniref:Uncharacterized protein n=1 Tax=Desulfoluna butyratoxydans TaxID=231438 RepID=A0A4U8YQF7_9BACT|nr:DNA-binding protein [Desulfoluna butyratoxydans]VFQ43473.1 hypothetical protein MSL71_11080 [Desulfoluna butyratoxydans]